jgi:hypothetical protein
VVTAVPWHSGQSKAREPVIELVAVPDFLYQMPLDLTALDSEQRFVDDESLAELMCTSAPAYPRTSWVGQIMHGYARICRSAISRARLALNYSIRFSLSMYAAQVADILQAGAKSFEGTDGSPKHRHQTPSPKQR